MALFGGKQPSGAKAVIKHVEAVLEEMGVSAEETEIPSSDGLTWGLMKGSAEVYVSITEGEDQSYFHVVSPLMICPEEKLEQIFRRLLELNTTELTGAAFGVRGERIVVCAGRPATGLDRAEIKDMIVRVGTYADHYDDLFVAEFGGRKHSEG